MKGTSHYKNANNIHRNQCSICESQRLSVQVSKKSSWDANFMKGETKYTYVSLDDDHIEILSSVFIVE